MPAEIRPDFVAAVRDELAAQGRTVTDDQARDLVEKLGAGAFAFEAQWSIAALNGPTLAAAIRSYFDRPAQDATPKAAAFGTMSEEDFLKLPASVRIAMARKADKAAPAPSSQAAAKEDAGVKLSPTERMTRARAEAAQKPAKDRRAEAQRAGNERWQANGLRRLGVELSGAEVALSRSRDDAERSYLQGRVADLKARIDTLKSAVPAR
jgi:hypothetical protein